MKVAFVSIEYPPDPFSAGIGSYTQALANALTKRGHRVHVITRGSADSVTDEDGVTVHRLTPARPPLPTHFQLPRITVYAGRVLAREWRYRKKIARRLHSLIRTEGLDLIEAADFMAEGILFRTRRYPAIPFVVRLHTPFCYAERIVPSTPEIVRQAMKRLERALLLKASHITAPSHVAADVFAEELQLKNRRIRVIPNIPSLDPQGVRYSNEQEDKMVLFVGRISKWKGADVLTKTIPKVVARVPGVQFVFVGADHLPIEGYPTSSAYLRSLLPEAFHSHMVFTGHLPLQQIRPYLEKSTLCVLPSLFEAFGYTCLEAMSFGKAVIGSNQGGMVDLLDGGRAGLLYTPPDDNELAKHIVELLERPEKRRQLGKKARTRATEHYNQEQILEDTLRFYAKAINDTRSAGPNSADPGQA